MAEQPDVAVSAWRPDGWFDKTMIVYAAPTVDGAAVAANMVVARDALGTSETFREYCNRQIENFRAALPQFHREDEGPGQVNGRDAFRVRFTWLSGTAPLRQQVFFISAGQGVIVTFTCTAAADDYANHQAQFEQGLSRLTVGAH